MKQFEINNDAANDPEEAKEIINVKINCFFIRLFLFLKPRTGGRCHVKCLLYPLH